MDQLRNCYTNLGLTRVTQAWIKVSAFTMGIERLVF